MADDSDMGTMLAGEVLALRTQLRRAMHEAAALQEEMQMTNEGLMVLSTVVDVTQRKQAAAEQARLLEEIARQHAQLRLLNQELATAQETERKELAHELHDRVGQNLTALNLALSLIQSQLANQLADGDPVLARMADAQRLVEQITEQTRDVMADLHPPTLEDYGLLTALRWYADRLTQQTGIPIDVAGEEPDPRLGEGVEMTLFRIVQEALTNALKHAGATHLAVTLTPDDEQVQLQIADNGCGFTPAAERTAVSRGWGIPIMQERIAALGGVFQMESQPGQGTVVLVEVKR